MPSPGDQIREPPTRVDVVSPSRPMVVSLAWDIAINATIPVACYWFSKRLVSRSELTALVASDFAVPDTVKVESSWRTSAVSFSAKEVISASKSSQMK